MYTVLKWGSVDNHFPTNTIPFWNDMIIVKNIHKTGMFFVKHIGNMVQVVKVSWQDVGKTEMKRFIINSLKCFILL